MNLQITELDKKEMNKVIDLFCLVWNEPIDKVRDKTNWAFSNNFSKVLVFKNKEGEIIAVRGGIKWPLIYNDKELNCYQFHGTCVHPDYRRIGLFTKLNKEFIQSCNLEKAELIFNVSVKASKLGYEKLGWQYIKGFRRLTYIRKPIRLIFKNRNQSQDKLIHPKVKNEIDVSNDFIDARNNKLKNTIHCKYTNEFLKWRLSNESENYKEAKTKDALIIYKVKYSNGEKEIIIGECFLIEYKFKPFSEVIDLLIKNENPDILYTYIFNTHPCYTFFLKKIFLPNPKRYNLNFGTKILNTGLKNDFKKNEWALSFLDIDTF